jgi:hypothetical protein
VPPKTRLVEVSFGVDHAIKTGEYAKRLSLVQSLNQSLSLSTVFTLRSRKASVQGITFYAVFSCLFNKFDGAFIFLIADFNDEATIVFLHIGAKVEVVDILVQDKSSTAYFVIAHVIKRRIQKNRYRLRVIRVYILNHNSIAIKYGATRAVIVIKFLDYFSCPVYVLRDRDITF